MRSLLGFMEWQKVTQAGNALPFELHRVVKNNGCELPHAEYSVFFDLIHGLLIVFLHNFLIFTCYNGNE